MKELVVIACGFKEPDLGKLLSNLYEWPFALDDIQFASMEGFIQHLKVEDDETSRMLAGLSGFKAWKTGQAFNWQEAQTVYFQGEAVKRDSNEYRLLMEAAFDACMDQNPMFREALLMTGNALLTHDMGKNNSTYSLLTEAEYLRNLYRLRARAQQEAA